MKTLINTPIQDRLGHSRNMQILPFERVMKSWMAAEINRDAQLQASRAQRQDVYLLQVASLVWGSKQANCAPKKRV